MVKFGACLVSPCANKICFNGSRIGDRFFLTVGVVWLRGIQALFAFVHFDASQQNIHENTVTYLQLLDFGLVFSVHFHV